MKRTPLTTFVDPGIKEIIQVSILVPELKNLIRESIQEALQQFKPQEEAKDPFLSIKQASAFLGLSVSTLYSYNNTRTIAFHKRGKQVYYKQSDLEAWLMAGKKKSADEIRDLAADFSKKGGVK